MTGKRWFGVVGVLLIGGLLGVQLISATAQPQGMQMGGVGGPQTIGRYVITKLNGPHVPQFDFLFDTATGALWYLDANQSRWVQYAAPPTLAAPRPAETKTERLPDEKKGVSP